MLPVPMHSAPFVGRREEVAKIREALANARNGSGSIVLLAGEPGIGKTSLAQEICRAAAWLGTPAVWGPAIEAEGTPPYWCWRQALTALTRVVPAAPAPDFAQLDSGTSQFVFFETVIDLLHRAAEGNSLVLVLDDLHWADTGSLRLLQVAAPQVPASRILIIGTYRPPGPDDNGALAQLLPGLLRERAVSRLTLGGLDQAATGSLLSGVLDREVSPQLARKLMDQTEGNPFYLIELAEGLRAGGSASRLPHSLGQIARRRLGLLSERCRVALGSAAVIGREFELGLLVGAIRESEAGVRDAIGEGVAAAVVEEIGPGKFQFSHALLREALYLDLPSAERAAAHARIAAAIGALDPVARAANIDALAQHLRRALPLGAVEEALAATLEAAQAAEAQLAFEQSADLYAEAIELQLLEKPPRHSRADLLLRLARCRYRAGTVVAAWQATQLAAAAAREEHQVRALAEAALVVSGLLIRGSIDMSIARPLLALGEEALQQLGGADAVLEARLLGQVASLRASLGIGPPTSDQALETARRAADPVAHFLALQAKELEIAGEPTRAEERLELSTEAVRVARQVDDPAVAVWAHAWRLGASYELGIRGQADSELAALADAVDRIKEPMARWRLEVARGSLALIDGRYADVVEAAARALEIGLRSGHRGAATLAWVLHFSAAARTGDTASDEVLRELSGGRNSGWYAAHLADQGRIAELREYWAGISHSFLDDMPRVMWPVKAMGSAKVAVALEDRAWAARVYEEVRSFPHLHMVQGFLGGYEGPFVMYAGQLAALLGRRDEAQHLLERAIDAASAIGSPPFEALSKFSLASLLRRSGQARDRARAVALLEQAAATAERLGMRPLGCAVAAELKPLQQLDGRPTSLSPREVEVVALVRDGLTNRAIGERLHISERTAENHVKNILDKLGLDSRVQIAAWSAGRAR